MTPLAAPSCDRARSDPRFTFVKRGIVPPGDGRSCDCRRVDPQAARRELLTDGAENGRGLGCAFAGHRFVTGWDWPMANRPSVQEILEAARRGGSARPGGRARVEPAPGELTAAPAPPPRADVLTPSALGRPLTVQEKLAAARAASPAIPGSAAVAREAPRDVTAPIGRALAPDETLAAAELAEAPRQSGTNAENEPASPAPRRSRVSGASFVSRAAVAWSSFAAACKRLVGRGDRFASPDDVAEPPKPTRVGFPADFLPESVDERFAAECGFWVVRSTAYEGQDTIYALATACKDLGCCPTWHAGKRRFICAGHGAVFSISGVNLEGPAPRPLERCQVTIADDGQIVVDRSRTFREELGQWSDPGSFIPM